MAASRTLLFAVGASLLISAGCVLKEKRLHADLLAGYNRQTRPVLNESDTVHLQMGLGLIDFTIDPVSDVMESLVWVRAMWVDEYLRWEPSEYDGLTKSFFNPNHIWMPDICLYNGWDTSCHVMAKLSSNAIVDSKGGVLIVPPVRLSHRCELDRTNWPRDVASCRLKFGSWTYDGNRLNVSYYGGNAAAAADVSDLLQSSEWEVANFTAEREVKYYDCCPEAYHSITFMITARRNEHRTAELSVPIVCSSVLMLLSFLIPVQSPQKLTFCWVSVLITVLGLFNMFSRMPSDAHGTASIASFYVVFVVLLLVFTLLEVLVVLLSRPRSTPLPRCLRACLSGLVGRLLCLDTPLFHDYSQEDNEMLDAPHENGGEMKHMVKDIGKTYEWALLAGAADRLCGLAFLLIVAVSVPPSITWA
ncbi:acetylcholine receptor subunit alpha-L1-like [Amphibalanus amphitrite]|uniref:acetylcholine receptor subunit alpha-L1-like n=1 Tax=Amphibalanus amphitrite TaxID=1232801 RepID=UPI001C90EB5F|nr:acetylcholine receptor subunit alpha-L1-like [Amphibalanus amphitrite]